MENLQKIRIDNKEYFIIDSIQNLRAEDSFIHRSNKLKMFKGNGEARKYIGSYKGDKGKIISDFFEFYDWGVKKNRYKVIQENRCFFSKTNLLKYLYDARIEYQKQEQVYNNDISVNYSKNLQAINSLENEELFFSIINISDLENNQDRAYIRSDDAIWAIWRKLILPKISYLSILKLIPIDKTKDNLQPLFYFRIFLDYSFRTIVHPKLIDHISNTIIEKQIPKRVRKSVSRIGATDYRKKVIEHMPQCPFTKISDEKLLIASHIKPYSICIKEGKENEASDYLNGITLTPTYDKLFDQGYITFKDNGDLICGTLLSRYTWERLGINPNAKNNMRIFPENREKYLEFHRKNVFQDNIDEIYIK